MDPTDDAPARLAYEDVIRMRAKRELRKRMRAVRGALPPKAIAERSASLVARVLAEPAWQRASTVALFSAMPDEVQTAALVEAARVAGKRVALPVVVDDTKVLAFRAPYDGGVARAMVTSAYGIEEPGDDAPAVDLATIDFVLVPALAVDPRGYRIGYGGGYYDATLPLATRAVRVAVAFDFQLIAEVPNREDDVPAHRILTDRRAFDAEPGTPAPASPLG